MTAFKPRELDTKAFLDELFIQGYYIDFERKSKKVDGGLEIPIKEVYPGSSSRCN